MQLVANYAGQSATDWQPSIKQHRVLNAAAEAGIHRSVTAIAKQAGVRRQTIYEWLNNDPAFRHAWDELPRNLLRTHLPGVVAAMVRKAQGGDVQAAKLVLEAAGLLGGAYQDARAGATTTNLHLQIIQRAGSLEEFERIKAAIDAQQRPMIEAQPSDATARGNGKAPIHMSSYARAAKKMSVFFPPSSPSGAQAGSGWGILRFGA